MPSEEEKNRFLEKIEAEIHKEEKENTEGKEVLKRAEKRKKTPPKKKKKMSALVLFATTFLLFLFVVILLIFVMSVGGSGNPILQFFGQEEESVKEFLLSVVNGSFGFFSVILLMTIAISLFLGFSYVREKKEKRKQAFIFAFTGFLLQFLTVLAWLGMWNFVNNLVTQASDDGGNIILILPSGEELSPPILPEDTKSLEVPVDLDFSIRDIEERANRYGYEVRSLQWDFEGDGVYQGETRLREATKRFVQAGHHEVGVKIFLSNENAIEYVIAFDIPKGTFSANPSSGALPLDVQLDASNVASPLTGITQFEWDFDGDGVYEQTTQNPAVNHRFLLAGDFTVHLQILDQNGQVYRFSRTVQITEGAGDLLRAQITSYPETGKSGELSINIGDQVDFSAEHSKSLQGKITEYEWSFLNGTEKKQGKNIGYRFSEEGEFEVLLTVRDEDGNVAEDQVLVKVIRQKTAPKALFRTNPSPQRGTISGLVPLLISFDASISEDADNNIVSYEWDFNGDGEVDETGDKIEHFFRETGEYNVLLRVVDADGYQDTENVRVLVRKQSLSAVITADPETAEMPCQVDFDGSLSACDDEDCEITAYEWDFGDSTGKQLAGAHMPHRFSRIGKYIVNLTVHTNKNTKDTVEKYIFCRETPLKACFSASRTTGTAPMTVSLDPSCSTGTVQKWSWDFGDGILSSRVNTTHTFSKPGNYTTTLTIVDEKNNVAQYSIDLVAQ